MANNMFATILKNTDHAAVNAHVQVKGPRTQPDPRVADINAKFKTGKLNRNQYLAAIGAVSDSMHGERAMKADDYIPKSIKFAKQGAGMAWETGKFIPQTAINLTAAVNNLANRASGVPQQSVEQQFTDPFTRSIMKSSGATGKGKQLAGDVVQIGATIAGGAGGTALRKKLIEIGLKNQLAAKTVANAAVGAATGAVGNVGNSIASDEKMSLKSVGQDLVAGAVTGGAVGAGATLARPIAQGTTKAAKKGVELADKAVSTTQALKTGGIPKPFPRVSDAELRHVRDVLDNIHKHNPYDNTPEAVARFKKIAQKLDIPYSDSGKLYDAVDQRGVWATTNRKQMQGKTDVKKLTQDFNEDERGSLRFGNSSDLGPAPKPEPKTQEVRVSYDMPQAEVDKIVAAGKQPVFDKDMAYKAPVSVKVKEAIQPHVEKVKTVATKEAVIPKFPGHAEIKENAPANVAQTGLGEANQQQPQPKSGLDKIGERPKADSPNKVLDRVNEFAHKVYTQTIDRYHPIMRIADKAGKGDAMRNAMAGHYGAASTASFHIDNELKPVLKGVDANDLRTYTIAQRDMELAAREVKGSDTRAGQTALDKLKTKIGDEKYQKIEARAEQLYAYQKSLVTNYLVKSGVMTKEAAEAMFGKNQKYVPFKRIMDVVDEHLGQLPGKQAGSVSSQDVIKGIKGSNRQIVDPLESIVENTYKIVGLAKRQEVASNIVNLSKHLPEGLITPLRTAENVKARIDIFSQMKDLKPVQKQLERYVATRSRWAGKLNKELAKLNQEGLHIALKPQAAAQPMRTPGRYVQRDNARNMQFVGTWNKGEFSGQVNRSLSIEGQLSNNETKQLVNNLVNLPRKELERIKAKIATRENKLAPILDDIADVSDQVKAIKEQRMNLRNDAALLKDAEAKGMTTISRFKDGIKEIYQVPKDIAEAAKGLNEEQLHTIVKIVAPITRTFRATATGINPEFGPKNVARDLQQAFVVAGVHPVDWAKGFAHYIKKDDLYKQFQKAGGVTSRISQDPKGLQRDVKDITGKGMSVTNPKQLLKMLEKVGEASEQPTRLALFEKELKKQSKKGVPLEEALQFAARGAQEGTTNFARHGAAMPNVNALYAFLNARMQGTDRLVRAIKTDPLTTIPRLGIVTISPALALYAYNRNFKEYNDPRIVSDYDKENNFIIMTPSLGKGRFIKIPKGDVGKLANPLEAFLAYAEGEKQPADIKKAVAAALTGFLPGKDIGDVLPTAIKPAVEVGVNKNFFTGQPIIPDYKKNYPKYKQDTNSTAPIYRAIGKQLGVSPAQVQNIARGYFTGFARIGENLTTPGMSKSFKTPNNEQGDPINKALIVRGFVGGAKQSRGEYATTLAKKINSINYELNDITAGINRHDLTQVEFDQKKKELKKKQQDIRDQAWKQGYGSDLQAALDTIKTEAKKKAAETRKKNGTSGNGSDPRAYNQTYGNTYNRVYQ